MSANFRDIGALQSGGLSIGALQPSPNVTAPVAAIGVGLAIATAALASAQVSAVAPSAPMGVSLAIPTAALSPWILVISVTAPTPSIGVSLSNRTARLFQWRLSPDVVHNLSAAMRAAAEAAIAPFIEVCEVDFLDETLRFAPLPFTSLERGHFADKVQAFGPVGNTPSDSSGALGAPETTMTLDDTDRQIAMLTEGDEANNLVGCAVRRYLAHPHVAFADWHLLFDGVITKEPEFPSEGRSAVVTARVDDSALELRAPRQGWTIDRTSWPNAHPDAITKSAPLVMGPHDSSNFQTSPGFLPGLHVDTLAHKYAFAAWRMKSIDAIFVDDVLTASGWTMSYATCRRGRVWTIVTFTASQGDAKITANGTGYDAIGSGAGSLVTNAADQLALLLSNFFFTDIARGSAWNATSSRIGTSLTSATGVVKTFLANRVPSASPYYGAPVTGADLVREFCDNHGLRAFWYAGKLEFAVEDVAVEPYNGHAIDGDQETISLGIGRDDIAVSPEVRVDHVPSAASGSFLSSFGVQLPDASGDETDALFLRWSDAS